MGNDLGIVVNQLRAEVMASGLGDRFEDLLEDDKIFVDLEVGRLARRRGISLDGYAPKKD